MTESTLTTITFFGLPLRTGSFDQIADWLIDRASAANGSPTVAAHINLYNYYLLKHDLDAEECLRKHYACLLDGIGMKIGAALVGRGWPPDLNGTDLFPLVMDRAARCHLPVFFLGGTPDVLVRTLARVHERFPHLNICGSHVGYFPSDDAARVAMLVRASGARILLVSMGSLPHRHLLLRYRTECGAALIWNVGGLFDFLAGAKPRAPRWVRSLRLEWAFRLLLEPRRMAVRTFVAAPWYFGHILIRRSRESSQRQLPHPRGASTNDDSVEYSELPD